MSRDLPEGVAVRVQAGRIDLAAEMEALGRSGETGALVTFTGHCRSEGGRLKALELEHYPGMAERQLGRVAAAAKERFGLNDALVIHRYGLIAPGEEIVFVACTGAHRGSAFDGAAFLMDYLKTSAPFWKREHLADGTLGGWIEAKAGDDAAFERWTG